MTNNKIVFLDTTVVNTKGQLHLEMYRKPQASENIINFNHANQKISTLVGELYIDAIIRQQRPRSLI